MITVGTKVRAMLKQRDNSTCVGRVVSLDIHNGKTTIEFKGDTVTQDVSREDIIGSRCFLFVPTLAVCLFV